MPKKILPVGEVFGSLTVLGAAEDYVEKCGQNCGASMARCVCGAVVRVKNYAVRNGSCNSCGCIGHAKQATAVKKTIPIGTTFGRWTVIAVGEPRPIKKGRWTVNRSTSRCRCECGQEKEILNNGLRTGASLSCGCLAMDVNIKRMTTHGESGNGRSPEYNAWASMISRCEDAKCRAFKHYGGRGIRVCQQWRESYETFLADMGRRPTDGHSIERIDVNGNYEPCNCSWATSHEQQRNKRTNRVLTIGGVAMCASDWAQRENIPLTTILSRLKYGYSDRDAVFLPPQKRGSSPRCRQQKVGAK